MMFKITTIAIFLVSCILMQSEGLSFPQVKIPSLPSVTVPSITVPPVTLPSLPVSLPSFPSPASLPSAGLPLPVSIPNIPSLSGLEKAVPGEPTCAFKGLTGSCCMSTGLKDTPAQLETCLNLKRNGGKTNVALAVNGKEVFQQDIDAVGEACYPVPSLPLKGCLNVYYMEVSMKDMSANACYYVSLQSTLLTKTQLLNLNFGCVKFSKGKFEQNSEHTPESQGILNLDFANGKIIPGLSIGNPFKVINAAS